MRLETQAADPVPSAAVILGAIRAILMFSASVQYLQPWREMPTE